MGILALFYLIPYSCHVVRLHSFFLCKFINVPFMIIRTKIFTEQLFYPKAGWPLRLLGFIGQYLYECVQPNTSLWSIIFKPFLFFLFYNMANSYFVPMSLFWLSKNNVRSSHRKEKVKNALQFTKPSCMLATVT